MVYFYDKGLKRKKLPEIKHIEENPGINLTSTEKEQKIA
jgi:hypothetical protein